MVLLLFDMIVLLASMGGWGELVGTLDWTEAGEVLVSGTTKTLGDVNHSGQFEARISFWIRQKIY